MTDPCIEIRLLRLWALMPLCILLTFPLAGMFSVFVIFGGPPYVVLAAGMFTLLRGRSVEAHWTAALAAPLVYAILLFVFNSLLFTFWKGDNEPLAVALVYALYSLPIAYAFVATAVMVKVVVTIWRRVFYA